MSWRGDTIDGDGYEWICSFLKDCNGDLLEFELDLDSQHFFDNMDVLLQHASRTPHPCDHRSSPLQLTPFMLSMIPDLQSISTYSETEEAMPASSISFRALLEEAQLAGKPEVGDRTSFQVATSPRKRRTGARRRRGPTAVTDRVSTKGYEKPTTRSSSRKKFTRRLFY